MTDYPSIDRIADLQQLIADFAKVERAPDLADNGRRENDVEHSFGLALTCWFLLPKIAPDLDMSKVLRYALAHDIVEIFAGDTFVFDEEAMKSKRERETAAISKLRHEWPDFSDMVDHAERYMERSDEEAKFVKAVDKLLPVIMIELGDAAKFWTDRGLTLAMERENKVTIHVSSHVSPYYELLLAWLDRRGNIPKS